MKYLKILKFVMVMIIAMTANKVHASHIASAHMYANYVGANTYEIVLELYRDCTGISMPTSVSITKSSASCGLSLPNETLPRDTFYIQQGALCPNVASTCTNTGSSFVGYEAHIYKKVVTLPAACSDWEFTWSTCCRNGAIINIGNGILPNPATGDGICITLRMNTLNFPTNNTPRYTALPIPYMCVNQPQNYVNNPVDFEVDSLQTYNSQPINNNCTSTIPYQAGFSLANPIMAQMPQGYNVNPLTGSVLFIPTLVGSYAIAFRTVEFSPTGDTMSVVERDVQLNVVNCNTPPPTIDSFLNPSTGLYSQLDSLSGGVILSNSPLDIGVCPGDDLVFKVTGYANSATNQLYTLIDNLNIVAPGATYTPVPATQGVSPLSGVFEWTPTAGDIGNHTITIWFADSTCTGSLPIVLLSSISLNIKVFPGVEAGPDLDYCGITSDTVAINATGPSNATVWNWTTLAGATPTDLAPVGSPNVKAWPATTTTYVVHTNALTTCKNTDTVVVEVHPPINADAGPGSTICANQNYQIISNINAAASDSILWSPNYNISSVSAPAPQVYPGLSTMYQLEILDTNGCLYHDSVEIIVNGVAPAISAWAELDTICPDGDVQLHSVTNSQLCGLAQSTCGGTNQTATLNVGISTSNNAFHPFNFKTPKSRSQFILTKDDLNGMGIVGANYINSLAYNVVTKGTHMPMRNFKLRMACTSQELFTTTDFNPNVYDLVYSEDSLFSVAGVNTLSFDIPYYWDGETNLIIDLCFDAQYNPSIATDNVDVLIGATNQWAYKITNTAAGTTPACEETPNNISNIRPKITLGYCADLGYTLQWTPSTFLNSNVIADPYASNVTNDPMSWTVTATSASNSNCKNSETITVYQDKSSSVVAEISAPDYNGGAWNQDSVVLCESPSIFNLRLDTLFGAPEYKCEAMNTLCPASAGYQLAPMNISIQNIDHSPLSQYYRAKRSQYLVTADELYAIGLTEGEIKTLAWNIVNKSSTIPYRNFSIKMGCTTADSLIAMEDNTNFATVYSAELYQTEVGWDTFNLQKHYGWDGTDNLIIEICYWNGISGPEQPVNSTDVVSYSLLGMPVAQYRYSQITSPLDLCEHLPAGPYVTGQQNTRPNFRFEICKTVEPSYYWTPGDFINDTTEISTFGIGVDTRYIYSYATGRNGCLLKDSVKVVTPKHDYRVSPLDTFICSTDMAYFDAGVGEKATSYQWIPTTNLTNPTGEATQAFNPVGGSYPYSVIWTDDYGCMDTGYVVLNVWDTPVVQVDPILDTIKYGSSIIISSTGGEIFSWSPINSLDNPFSNVVEAKPEIPTVYKVTTIDSNGCKGIGFSTIIIDYENPIFIPNAFTPDGDGKNDIFEVTNLQYEKIQLFQVYDRWGNKVFDAVEEGKTGWDGYINNEFANEGMYVYVIRLVYRNGELKTYKGDITLIR